MEKNINWITRSRRVRPFLDVSVKMWKNNRWSINFHNCATRITRTGYIQVGYTDNRLYFKPASKKNGLKVAKISAYTDRVSLHDNKEFTTFERDYRLKHTSPSKDNISGWYIELEERS